MIVGIRNRNNTNEVGLAEGCSMDLRLASIQNWRYSHSNNKQFPFVGSANGEEMAQG